MSSLAIGPLAISLSRLLILLGFAVALLLGWWLGRRRGVNVEPALSGMLFGGFLTARLVFVLLYLDDYLLRPMSIIDIRDGGFHFVAGLVGAAGIGLWFLLRQPPLRQPLLVSVAAGMMIWGIGSTALITQQEPGSPLPPLALWTLDGELVNLAELNDRPVVLNVWATWCPPCRREMPVFERAQQQREDIAFVFVNQGEEAEQVLDFLYDDELTLHNVLLDGNSQISRLLDTRAMPSTYFFDSEGNMVEAHLGELSTATLNRRLRQLR